MCVDLCMVYNLCSILKLKLYDHKKWALSSMKVYFLIPGTRIFYEFQLRNSTIEIIFINNIIYIKHISRIPEGNYYNQNTFMYKNTILSVHQLHVTSKGFVRILIWKDFSDIGWFNFKAAVGALHVMWHVSDYAIVQLSFEDRQNCHYLFYWVSKSLKNICFWFASRYFL